jgi:hypothetical protein
VDVYAFAMIALELVSLKLPFDDWEDEQIRSGVPNGERPDIPDCDPFFKELIINCWQGEPTKRPDYLQILKRLKSHKGETMWPIQYPNLQKLSSQFPFVGKMPKPASDIIIDRMNLKDLPNDWKVFVSQIWPTYTIYDMQMKFKEGMKSVLDELATRCEKTAKLLDLLEKVKRNDVLMDLEEYSRYLLFNNFY